LTLVRQDGLEDLDAYRKFTQPTVRGGERTGKHSGEKERAFRVLNLERAAEGQGSECSTGKWAICRKRMAGGHGSGEKGHVVTSSNRQTKKSGKKWVSYTLGCRRGKEDFSELRNQRYLR